MIETTSRQPIFQVPTAVLGIIGLLAAIHGGRVLLGDATDADLLARFAFVPARLTAAFDPLAVMRHLAELSQQDATADGPAAAGLFFLGTGSAQPWTLLTYAMLHGSWTHLGLNAIWFLAFGAPVARRLGSARFYVLMILTAVAGALTHYAVDPLSLQPLIGASAAVSGCMGAALRFMFRPLTGALDRRPGEPAHMAPRRSLLDLVRDRRAAAFLAVWFASDIVMGIAAVPFGLSDAPVAWQAHVGGFLVGLLAFPLFDRQAAPALPDTVESGPTTAA